MTIPVQCAHTRLVDPNLLVKPNRHSAHQIQFLSSIINGAGLRQPGPLIPPHVPTSRKPRTEKTDPMKRTYKLIAGRGHEIVFDDLTPSGESP